MLFLEATTTKLNFCQVSILDTLVEKSLPRKMIFSSVFYGPIDNRSKNLISIKKNYYRGVFRTYKKELFPLPIFEKRSILDTGF